MATTAMASVTDCHQLLGTTRAVLAHVETNYLLHQLILQEARDTPTKTQDET